MKKRISILALLALVLSLFISCTTVPVAISDGELGDLKGTSTRVKLFQFIPVSGGNYIDKAAWSAGITKICTVEYETLYLGLFSLEKTIVTGTGPGRYKTPKKTKAEKNVIIDEDDEPEPKKADTKKKSDDSDKAKTSTTTVETKPKRARPSAMSGD